MTNLLYILTVYLSPVKSPFPVDHVSCLGQELKLEEVEEQQAKYEMVFKNIEELDRQGVQILSPGEIEKLRKRFKDVHTKFSQYQKPAGDSKYN